MTVKVETNPALLVAMQAAVDRGLMAGGEVVLALSDAKAPTEPEPRHGEHLVDTGFVRPELGETVQRVAVGYMAFWALWQEQKEEYHHEHGQAHFLEDALIEGAPLAFEQIAATIRAEVEK